MFYSNKEKIKVFDRIQNLESENYSLKVRFENLQERFFHLQKIVSELSENNLDKRILRIERSFETYLQE